MTEGKQLRVTRKRPVRNMSVFAEQACLAGVFKRLFRSFREVRCGILPATISMGGTNVASVGAVAMDMSLQPEPGGLKRTADKFGEKTRLFSGHNDIRGDRERKRQT